MWETAIANPTSIGVGTGDESDNGNTAWDTVQPNEFEFVFDSEKSRITRIGSQSQLLTVGNEVDPIDVIDAVLIDLSLGDLDDDDECWSSVIATTEDFSYPITLSDESDLKCLVKDVDERPAIHIEIGKQDRVIDRYCHSAVPCRLRWIFRRVYEFVSESNVRGYHFDPPPVSGSGMVLSRRSDRTGRPQYRRP